MRAAPAFLLILLAACEDRVASRRDPSPAPSFALDPASGETRARIAAAGGATGRMRSGERVPVALPRGFTLYPGARVVSNTLVEGGGERRVLLIFETGDPLAKVVGFYRGQAEAARARLTLDLVSDTAASLGSSMPGGFEFALTAHRSAAITRAELSFVGRE